jgi:hypothetical protein
MLRMSKIKKKISIYAELLEKQQNDKKHIAML